MTDNEIYTAAQLFQSQQYGPLYIVSGSHARGRTFYAYLLEPGQVLAHSTRQGPNNKHPGIDVRQEVFGVVRGQPGWTEEYGWKQEHPAVQDGSAQALLLQLIEAHKQCIALGMTHADERHAWVATWAQANLGNTGTTLALPELQDPADSMQFGATA